MEAARILEEASPEGLIGFEVTWDNCHPTLDGYARIAGGFVEQIERIFDVRRRHEAVAGSELEGAWASTARSGGRCWPAGVTLAALRGDGRESVARWREAYRLDPQSTLQRAAHPYLRQIMQRNGIEDLSKLLQS